MDTTNRRLEHTQRALSDVVKHAYVVIYVEAMLRAEREGETFLHVIRCELEERGLLDFAEGIQEFERHRQGLYAVAMQEGENECCPD